MRHLPVGVGLKCRLLLMCRLMVLFNVSLVCERAQGKRGKSDEGVGGETDCLGGRLGIRISLSVEARDTPLETSSEL